MSELLHLHRALRTQTALIQNLCPPSPTPRSLCQSQPSLWGVGGVGVGGVGYGPAADTLSVGGGEEFGRDKAGEVGAGGGGPNLDWAAQGSQTHRALSPLQVPVCRLVWA